jgi:hypothetical protein
VDITPTGIISSNSKNTFAYNQQQNYNTLVQSIGLRTQLYNISVSSVEAQDVVELCFGNRFQGLHTVWQIEFATEHTDVYRKADNYVHFLEQDCEGVAFTSNLNETVTFAENCFETVRPDIVNLRFKISS